MPGKQLYLFVLCRDSSVDTDGGVLVQTDTGYAIRKHRAFYCSKEFMDTSIIGRYWFRPVPGWVFRYSGNPVYEAWDIGIPYPKHAEPHVSMGLGHPLKEDPAAALAGPSAYTGICKKEEVYKK
jgi:hypothetical protein